MTQLILSEPLITSVLHTWPQPGQPGWYVAHRHTCNHYRLRTGSEPRMPQTDIPATTADYRLRPTYLQPLLLLAPRGTTWAASRAISIPGRGGEARLALHSNPLKVRASAPRVGSERTTDHKWIRTMPYLFRCSRLLANPTPTRTRCRPRSTIGRRYRVDAQTSSSLKNGRPP